MTRSNTLDLVGDGDEDDLLEEIEASFGVEIEGEDAEGLLTVGDLQDLLVQKLEANDARRSVCLTAAAFYRLRKAISSTSARRVIVPGTRLDRSLVGRDYQDWRQEVESRCGLRLPAGQVGYLGTLLLFLLFFGGPVVAAVLTNMFGAWGLAALVAWPLIGPLLSVLPDGRPALCHDVGALARAVTCLNYRALSDELGSRHRDDVLVAIDGVIRDATGFDGAVDRCTTFFAR